ncbi:MAG: hypothetical protein R3F14_08920 [Polyangiaceae bacterium]
MKTMMSKEEGLRSMKLRARWVAVVGALGLGIGTAWAGAPDVPAGATASASGPGAVSGSGAALVPSAPDTASAAAPPQSKTPPVSWEGAVPLEVARPSEMCKAVRLGEWARVTCSPPGFIMDIRLMAGSADGVLFREAKAEGGAHLIFPMREGDRREICVSVQTGSGYTVEEDLAVVVSEVWLPGEPAPTIAIAGNPR